MAKKKLKMRPIPYRLEELESKRLCVTADCMVLLYAVLDRRHEFYPDVSLRLYRGGEMWSNGVPHVLKTQLERKEKNES